MAELYFLSKSDVDLLKGLVEREKRGVKNTTQRPRIEEAQYGAPSIYIALPPPSGIPALTRQTIGTGSTDTPTEYDSPGQALCKIYKIIDNGGLGTDNIPDLIEAFDLAQPVYNLSTSEIGYDWIHVHKDAYGSWLAVTGGGGPGCDPQNAIWHITVLGMPTGGSLKLTVKANGVSTQITWNYNDSASTFASTLATGHSEVNTTDISVTGGPLNNSTIVVEWIGNYANTDMQLPYADWSSLTGGSGVGIVVSMSQKGHS